ncbi:MAG: exodeoxyribonuclease IX [Deltaproteobacteria bacterium]|nr:exodeoxyribonuclease IX [Deltaproteobacteria bacterium]MBW2421208.1 exodeoxyribonuclease IX [Deltaproteobacteria bacterium]
MARRRPVVHILDGHVYIFRAYYSMPHMEAADGTPTAAAYGFANTLVKLVADPGLSHAAVCFDYAMESFRNEIEPEYKANRGETPDDLEPQFELCFEVASALGLPVFAKPEYEADDLIATLTEDLVKGGADVVIVTSDKDLSQLVREDGRVLLHDLAKERTLDADGVREKFGVSPEQIPDYLGLVGDAVDNLPGVPGVGPKSAGALLSAFGTIEEIPGDHAAWGDVKVRGAKGLAEKIARHRDRALRTKELATVVREVPGVQGKLDELALAGADREQVERLFDRLGWGRIRDRVSYS